MGSNSIDDLINVIIENTEIDEDTARSCILDELALVDDLYKKEFFNENLIVVAHSIGNPMFIKYISKDRFYLNACLLYNRKAILYYYVKRASL